MKPITPQSCEVGSNRFDGSGSGVRQLLARALLAFAAVVALSFSVAAEPLPRSVLLLDQSGPTSPWGRGFRDSLLSALRADRANPVEFYSEVLDLGRFRGPEYEESLLDHFRNKYRNKKIGVIAVHGSSALDLYLRLRAKLWPTVPVVAGFLDEATVARLNRDRPSDFTGTILQLRLSNSVTAARAIVPNLRRLALVGDSFERDPFRSHYVQELTNFAREFEIIDLSGLPMATLKNRVAALPDDAAIIYTVVYRDTQGVTYISPDALFQVAQAANRPIVGESEPLIGSGLTGGFLAQYEPVARETAQRALRILNGEKAADIPITVGDFTRPIFDWRQLQRFGVSESRLPPGSEVRFRPPTLWDQYRWQLTAISAAIVLQALMIAGLLIERRRRRTAEQQSRDRFQEVVHLNRTATAGALSASIAHELNQPLGAILCNTEAAETLLAGKSPDLEQIRDILADIRRDDQRASDVIKHLRGLLRKRDIEFQEFDLNDAIRSTLNVLEAEAIKCGVELKPVHLQGSLQVRADPVHLQQVILNLATNAMDSMQACAPGKRVLTMESALASESEVEVSVLDSGDGIPADKLSNIFDAFYTTKSHGTGLGLSIARMIVETCGGRIWAENRAGGGAAFRFTLPLAKARVPA
jgi:signal transduction histidine kinase